MQGDSERFPKVIGLVGYKQSGKDTACGIIQDAYPFYYRVAFADEVRVEAQAILDGTTPFPADLPAPLRRLYEEQFDENVLLRHNGDIPITVWDRPYTPRIRAILQQHGTEYRRAQDPDYWVKAWQRVIAPLSHVIATDVRFPNEAKAILEMGGVLWLVWRGKPAVEDIHESEQYVESLPFSQVIDNQGTVEEFQTRLLRVMEEFGSVRAA